MRASARPKTPILLRAAPSLRPPLRMKASRHQPYRRRRLRSFCRRCAWPRRRRGRGSDEGGWPASSHLRPLLVRQPMLHEIRERGNRMKVVACGGLVLHLDAELGLQHHHDLEGVDGVQPEAAGEEGIVILDVVGRHVFELQTLDQQFFQFLSKVIHGLSHSHTLAGPGNSSHSIGGAITPKSFCARTKKKNSASLARWFVAKMFPARMP